MDATVGHIMGTEGPDVSVRGGSGADLDSSFRQVGDRAYENHVACGEPAFPVKSFAEGVDQGLEYETDFSVVELLEHEADPKIEGAQEVREQAATIEAVELPEEGEVDQNLVTEKMDAKAVPTEETEVLDVSSRNSPCADLNSGFREVDREYGDNAAYEQLTFPTKSSVESVDHSQEYEIDSSVAEHLEHRTAAEFHDVDTVQEKMDFEIRDSELVDLQEQAAGTKEEFLKEHEVGQELVSENMDAKVVPIVDKEVPGVCNGGSPDLDSGPRQVGDQECGDHVTYEQLPLPVKSFDRGVDHRLQYEPGFSEAELLEQRTASGFHDSDTVQENMVSTKMDAKVVELQEQTFDTEAVELPTEQELDEELVSEKMVTKAVLVEKEVPDVSNGGCPDSDSTPRPVGDRECGDHADEQPSLPVMSFDEILDQGPDYIPGSSVAGHLEHRALGDVHEGDIGTEDVKEVQEQPANGEEVKSPKEQEVEPVYDKVDVETAHIVEPEVPDVFVGGSSGPDLDSSSKQVGDREYDNHVACEQLPLPVKSFAKGVDQGVEYEPDFLVAECLEYGERSDVFEAYTYIQDVQEVQAHNTEDPDVSIRESPDLISGPREVGGRDLGDDASYEQPSFLINSSVKGVDNGLEYEAGSALAEQLEHRATGDDHEVDTNMKDVSEVEKVAANMETIESFEEQEVDQDLFCRKMDVIHEVDRNVEDVQGGQEQVACTGAVQSPEEQEDQGLVIHSAKSRNKEEKNTKRASVKPGNLTKDQRVSYQLPPEIEGEFAVFALVWGKVKSHPWWPGQIFHPSDSSEKAMKYYRKDCYLVAYFGDRTFAWNEASVLKPFRSHFPQAERQNNSEAFQNAVSCALEEVARRVELGLACSCLSEETYDKIKYQIVENTGIRAESSKREGVDRSTGADSFQPDKLTEYVRSLACFPTSGVDRLELVVAKAQLLAFNRLKGFSGLPEFQYYEGLVEYDADTPVGDPVMSCENEHGDLATGVDAKKGPCKRKHDLKDIVYQRRKEKSMNELMGESMYYFDGDFDSHEEDEINLTFPTGGTKRKASGFLTDDSTAQQTTKTISLAKVSHTASPNPQQSFKVGECIRRVASQLTGSSVAMKGCSEGSNNKHLGDDADEVSEPLNDDVTESTPIESKESSLDDMLSQVHLSARDPMKGYSFLADIINFFSEFRNEAVTAQRLKLRKASGRKRKSSVPVGSPETFEFDDRNDSYWTDMVVQNNAEAKPVRRGRKRKDNQALSGDTEKPPQPSRRKYSRRLYHHDNHGPTPEMPTEDEKKLDLPTELMMNFGEMGSVPSELNLNKMFRRFGSLRESETEVDMQSCRARVVFKKRSDAEVAYSSAAMFNIFGSALVNYQLNYTPSVSFRASPLALTDVKEDAT